MNKKSGGEIVISGIAGRFPKSQNVEEFSHNLYNEVDMQTDEQCRWSQTIYAEIPQRKGIVKDLEKFDADFFKVSAREVNEMDMQIRVLLELSYAAILDAGIHPATMYGSNTAVFTAACFPDAMSEIVYNRVPTNGLSLLGTAHGMFANRISYNLGFHGISLTVDTACSSSISALQLAVNSILLGQCDAALVLGTNLTLNPNITINFLRLGVLDKEGYCRPFDINAGGYSRSEALAAIFLQKRKDAKRVYAQVLHVATNSDGYKPDGIGRPSNELQSTLFQKVYDDIGIDPRDINFVEAHCTGTVVGDYEECRAIDKVFSPNRSDPLIVGSHKSNMGHSEASSGLCAIIKAICCFETGMIPPNINFTEVRHDIPSLVEGRLKVCQKTTPLVGSLIAINSFGFGGVNGHVLLSQWKKNKMNGGQPNDTLPRLVPWAGRTEEAVRTIFDKIKSSPLDAEFIALLDNIQQTQIAKNLFRGYAIFCNNDVDNVPVCLTEETLQVNELKRPIVWLFSGMGSQWPEMGKSLLKIEHFRETIITCHKILERFGLDLMLIITSDDSKIFKNILHSFVGICSIQIALIDILKMLEVPADYLIGHSVGELGCAYADGALTLEETLLTSYYRGKISIDEKTIDGRMAAVGLSFKDTQNRLPPNIYIACRNSFNSCTVSGPKDDILHFVAKLRAENIFAKEVNSSGIAYHSKYIKKLGSRFLEELQNVILQPKRRSSKWLSTSVPVEEWQYEHAKFNTAEYHVNNLLSPVLFEEASSKLPRNCIIIEIAPHGLMQPIMRTAFPDAINISLAQRFNAKNDEHFITALGKMFLNGIPLRINRIYPTIQFPVSRGTPMISPLIKWDHSMEWPVAEFEMNKTSHITSERKVLINISEDEYHYMAGHIIDDRCLLPATSYLHLVRETLVYMTPGSQFSTSNIEFENIRFHRATSLLPSTAVKFNIVIHCSSGDFEVSEGKTAVVSGTVKHVKSPKTITKIQTTLLSNEASLLCLNSKEFYKEMRLRGYNYSGVFKSVHSASVDGSFGKIKWTGNWASFMDNMLQVTLLSIDSRSLYLPTMIEKITINTVEHLNYVQNNELCEVYYSSALNKIICGGIEITGQITNPVERRKQIGFEVLESYKFVPLNGETMIHEINDAASVCIQLAIEKCQEKHIKMVEVLPIDEEPTIELFQGAFLRTPSVLTEFVLLTEKSYPELSSIKVENSELEKQTSCSFVVAKSCLSDAKTTKLAENCLIDQGFLISIENRTTCWENILVPPGFILLSMIRSYDRTFILLQRTAVELKQTRTVIQVKSNDTNFNWLNAVKRTNKTENIVLLSQKDCFSGVLGLVNCLRQEPDAANFQCVIIEDNDAPPFELEHSLYSSQLNLELPVNIYRDGQWGTYRHLIFKENISEKAYSDPMCVQVERVGDIKSLTWVPFAPDRSNNYDNIFIHYSALNFRDIMLASGRLPIRAVSSSRLLQQRFIGSEYSGIKTNGQRVMGALEYGLLATQTTDTNCMIWNIPDTMSLRDAATIPAVYSTVYYTFFVKCTIESGKSILIHAGSGGVGLAAIRVAFAYGLNVYTTVSTNEKKEFLLKQFPQLQANNIGNSRDCSFEHLIMERTNGEGVDYILNCLSGDKFQATVRCLHLNGIFFEIGKFDIFNNENLKLKMFEKGARFESVLALDLLNLTVEGKQVYDLIEKDLRRGIIQPLPNTVFAANEVVNAFSYMAAAKHVGKILIQLRASEQSVYSLPLKLVPKMVCDFTAVYILVGGLGGFGVEMADWLVLRGAKHLVIGSRRGVTDGYQLYRINVWRSYGCEVTVNTADVATLDGCKKLLTESMEHGYIAGIFNLAVVLRDRILMNQTSDTFSECLAPKANATRYLDDLSRKLCPQLKYFVVFSSLACGRGNAGQSNYGMANSIMERIIEQRVHDKLPGKAIQWGAIGDVGIVAELTEYDNTVEVIGTLPQRIDICLAALDKLLTTDDPIVSSMLIPHKQSIKKLDVVQTVLQIVGIMDFKNVSDSSTLAELGIDSLMNGEIKQTLERKFNLVFTSNELKELTIAQLKEISSATATASSCESLKSVRVDSDNDDRIIYLADWMLNLGDENQKNQNILVVKKLESIEENQPFVLFIPGVEGVASKKILDLCKQISAPTAVLQLHTARESKSMDNLLRHVAQSVLDFYKYQKTFFIAAHSFGTILAIALAYLLEKNGLTGQICLIDGHVKMLKGIITDQFAKQNNRNFSSHVLSSMTKQYLPTDHKHSFYSKLDQMNGIDEQIKLCVGHFPKMGYSDDYMKEILEGCINRTVITHTYESNDFKLHAPITLIHCVDSRKYLKTAELNQHTSGKINCVCLDGDHLSVLENPELSMHINSLLSYKTNRYFADHIKTIQNTKETVN